MYAFQSFRPVAPFLFLAKVPFLNTGMQPCRYAYEVPLVTLILNIYGFVGQVQATDQETSLFVF